MQANPTLDQLQLFLAVAESGSFSAAGRRLKRAQSVVSYQIANLEAQLGYKLFEREGTREPVLTAAGRATLEDARRMAEVLQSIRSRAEGFNQGIEAEIALSVDVALPMPVLVTALKAFELKFPTVTLHLYIGSLGLIVDNVVSGLADFGIGGHPGAPEVRSVKIGVTSIVPVAAPDHPLARYQGPVPEDALRDHIQIVVSDQSDRTRNRNFNVFARRTWRVTDMRAKHAMMRDGLGWGGLPRWLVAEDLASGRLVELNLEAYPESWGAMFAMHRADRSPGPATTWLIEHLTELLGQFTTSELGGGSAPTDVQSRVVSPSMSLPSTAR